DDARAAAEVMRREAEREKGREHRRADEKTRARLGADAFEHVARGERREDGAEAERERDPRDVVRRQAPAPEQDDELRAHWPLHTWKSGSSPGPSFSISTSTVGVTRSAGIAIVRSSQPSRGARSTVAISSPPMRTRKRASPAGALRNASVAGRCASRSRSTKRSVACA